MGVPVEKIKQRVKELHEFNPMLGLRGCRLGIVYPEITEMQTRAIIEAAVAGAERGHPGQAGDHDRAGRASRRNCELSWKSSIASPSRCRTRRRPRSNTWSAR